MASKDPLLWCGEIAWYLCERDAACGYRSSLGLQLEIIKGASGSPDPIESKWHALQSMTTARSGGQPDEYAPLAKDRRMRRRWPLLSTYHRDILGVHYTSCARVGVDPEEGGTGYARFPRGLEAGLGVFAPVAWHLANLAGQRHAIIMAGESSSPMQSLEQFRASAEHAVRDAHQAYYDIIDAETPPSEAEDEKDEAFTDLAEELAALAGADHVRQGRDGVFRRVG
jgi:hypothetical protein